MWVVQAQQSRRSVLSLINEYFDCCDRETLMSSVEILLEQALREGLFSTSASPDAGAAGRATLLSRLTGLQNVDVPVWEALEQAVRRPGELSLSQQDANLLYFCDQVFEQCQQQADLEPDLLTAFLHLRPLLAGVLLREPAVVRSLHHPLIELLDLLWDAARYWSPELGRPGEKYRARLDEMLARLRTADPATAPFADWAAELSAQLDKDFQRAATLTSRICQTERGALAGKQAEIFVRQTVAALLAKALMPEAVEELFKGPLRNSLQVVYLRDGVDSDAWRQLLRTADLLLSSMQTVEAQEDKQQQYQVIGAMPGLLGKQLISITDPAEMEDWLARIEQLHMQILLGNTVELRPARPLSQLAADSGVQANVSAALLEQVARIPEGQWLVYRREGADNLRCRLALNLQETGQLIFVNVLGAKCLEKSLEDFAYLLAARHVMLLDADSNFSQILRDTVAHFLQLFQRQSMLRAEAAERQRQEQDRRRLAREKAQREAEKIAQERLLAQARAEEEARQQLEEQARRAEEKARKAAEEARMAAEEAQKAIEEAARFARAKAAQDAIVNAERQRELEAAEKERQLLAEKQARLQEWEAVQQGVRSLGVGAWVDIEINGERQRCKLAAVINSTDKLIFVGRDGRKLTEPRRDELIKLILDNKARIIEKGDQFESSLAKVIQTLRKD